MGDSWRSEPDDKDFAPATPATHMHSENDGLSGRPGALADSPAPTDSPAPAPEITAHRPAATSYGDLAAIIRLQSTGLERLASENERLMDRLETFFRLHEKDQHLRQDLQEQIQRLNQRAEACAPAQDADTIRREVRESMIEEIKPVLTAILDLLERSLERPAVALGKPPAQAPRDPFLVEELLRLPEILTRPLEELTTPVSEAPAGPPGAGAADPSEDSNDPGPSQRPAKRDRRDASGSALPGAYAWTNLFA